MSMFTEDRSTKCWAGRWAFLGGLWPHIPCPEPPVHVIMSKPHMPTIHLCEKHFGDALAAGMVTDPFITPEDVRRRRGGA